MIGAAVFGGLACKWRKVPILPTFDLVAMGFLIGQGMGRWGNFFNQEAFGGLVTDPAWQYFPYAVYIERLGEWHQATFFYESVACFLIFIFLMIYRRQGEKRARGQPLPLVLGALRHRARLRRGAADGQPVDV